MSTNHTTPNHLGWELPSGRKLLGAILATAITLLVSTASALALAPPVKLVTADQIGWEVNPSTKANTCVASSGECQPGSESEEPGGFKGPEGVAGSPISGNFYVADTGNHRVEEFNSKGEFLMMFGKGVNVTTHGDTCTQVEIALGAKCQAGTESGEVGQFANPRSVAVDGSGNVYVSDRLGERDRVQEFTAEGEFVLEIGQGVNQSTSGNVCTQKEIEEGAVCGEAEPTPGPSSGHGSFHFDDEPDTVAFGGEQSLLYVAERERIQEFGPGGKWVGEVPLVGELKAFAVEAHGNNIYVSYPGQASIQQIGPEGGLLKEVAIPPREASNRVIEVEAIAVDSAGRIALKAQEEIAGGGEKPFGALFESVNGPQLPGFTVPGGTFVRALSFNENDELYIAAAAAQAILSYMPQSFGEVETGSLSCKEESEVNTLVGVECKLNGTVNPISIEKTRVWFAWGATCALGSKTSEEELATVTEPLAVQDTLVGLHPNQTLCYQLTGTDQNVQAPEQFEGEKIQTKTPMVAPKVPGTPKARFVTGSSAVIEGEIDPENAQTEYLAEYSTSQQALTNCQPQTHCPGVAETPAGSSTVYGRTGATVEASGLQPNTTYHYRFVASNQAGTASSTQETTFTTRPAPAATVQTGPASQIGTTQATISGEVDPDGQPAIYTFEAGVYQGANTNYGILLTGPVGASTTPVPETFQLTGLQAGTTYAYRVAIKSGYTSGGKPIYGEPMLFTTQGLPAILASPSTPTLLATPSISFPETAAGQNPGSKKVAHRKHAHTRSKRRKKDRSPRKNDRRHRKSR